MDPLSAIASVIAIYQLGTAVSGLCFHYGHGVRQADKDAELVINEIETFLRYLRTVRRILERENEATSGADRLQNLSEIIDGESAALRMCRRHLEGIKSILIKVQSEGRFKNTMYRLTWPLKHEEVRKTVDSLKRFTEAVDRVINVDNSEIIRAVDTTTKRIRSSLETAEAKETKEKILHWLAYPDPSEIHEIIRRDRNDKAKTGRWFLDGSAFKHFRSTPQSVLWLHGDSGCGKSVLCSAVIDEIDAVQIRDSRTKLAYWYFSVTDKERTRVDNLLRALIVQFLLEVPIQPSLLDLWNSRKKGREAPKMADFEQMIRTVLLAEPSQTYYVVVDALDESDETERVALMQVIHSLALLEVDIHILITSRHYSGGVEKEIKDLVGFYDIGFEGHQADYDIKAHIIERLENDGALAKWSPEIRQLIRETLTQKAGGMFRWVDCQLQAVRKCRTPAQVRKILKTLPRDLHEVYARDLAKVDQSESQNVFRLLEWLAFPQEKIRLDEAIDILAIDLISDPPAFDEENRMVDTGELLRMCGSLVRLDRIAEDEGDSSDTTKVRFLAVAHTSVIDFLTTQPIKIGTDDMFYFSKAEANLRMAETCLTYLRYLSENTIVSTKDKAYSFSFAQKCARLWSVFYLKTLDSPQRVDMTRLNRLVMELITYPIATLNWLKLHNGDEEWLRMIKSIGPIEISQVKPAIYYAARLGLADIVKSLIQEGSKIDEIVGPPFGTPLVAASACGKTNVVLLLLDSGADPNLSGYFYFGTPLAAAITFERFDIVKLLLGREGVKLNCRCHPPLEVTKEELERAEEFQKSRAQAGWTMKSPIRTDQRRKLIETGNDLIKLAESADAKDLGSNHSRKRHATNETKRSQLTKTIDLCTRSTTLGTRDGPDCSDNLDTIGDLYQFLHRADAAWSKIQISNRGLVYHAVETQALDILRSLLAAGVDPNVLGGAYGTALQRACAFGVGDDFVELLLSNGARTDVYGGWHGSALHAACRRASIRTVGNLISAGAEVNRLDARSGSPLAQACMADRIGVVNLLLKNGAEKDIHPHGEGTPLYLACRYQNSKTVKKLLAHGADPNIQNCGNFDHALQAACMGENHEIVSLLLESRAKLDLYGGFYGSALIASCDYGEQSLVRMLLSHGADANLSVWNHGSPLVAACAIGNFEIAQILVQAGANIHKTNLAGHSPLLAAASSRYAPFELFEYLIHKGADPLQEDNRGSHALHYAARAQNSRTINSMLECGVKINVLDRNGWSPLHWAIASTEDSTETVRLLLQSGCDPNLIDKQGRTASDLAKIFERMEEGTALADTQQRSTESTQDSARSRCCDGCMVRLRYCKPESWHHCDECLDFDLCFRCILDKDTIHFKGHTFSDEPS